MKLLIRRLVTPFLVAAIAFAPTAAFSFGGNYSTFKRDTILGALLKTDGAQALVAAVLVVDDAAVLDFSIAELLNDKHARLTLLAPGNPAFENLLGLPAGSLDGLTVEELVAILPGTLPENVEAEEVAAILLKHVSIRSRYDRRDTENSLLAKGEISVADGSIFPVSVGASGVRINYETTIIKSNVNTRNGGIQYVNNVIADGLL